MKTSELLELVRAGYTKDEINAMETSEPAEQTATEPTAAEPAEAKETKPEATQEDIFSLTNQVRELTKVIAELQKNNAKSADSGEPKTETADSVIRDFFGMKERK